MVTNDQNGGGTGESELPDDPRYILKLYIVATTPKSLRAVANVRQVCEEYLGDRFDLEVIDISKRPDLAKTDQIIGAPTLVKLLPLPVRRLIGDMSRKDRLILGLDVGLA
jgi:circadian clock protein KaiB